MKQNAKMASENTLLQTYFFCIQQIIAKCLDQRNPGYTIHIHTTNNSEMFQKIKVKLNTKTASDKSQLYIYVFVLYNSPTEHFAN